ncbi:MAG UNVERIFIED_CONTAM: alanine racemase [Rickettsiaceae bacterium]|jgi:alanine racemase
MVFEGSDFAEISKLPKSVEYLMSHMACDDNKDSTYVKYQLDEFVKYTSKHNVKLSLAASGTMFYGPEYHFDMVRPGAACYGIGAISNPNIQRPCIAYCSNNTYKSYN